MSRSAVTSIAARSSNFGILVQPGWRRLGRRHRGSMWIACTRSRIRLPMSDHSRGYEEAILSAWLQSARPWATAVREGRIESRRLVTDRAIVEAVLSHKPRSAIDLGCGEGWLVRALAAQGVDVLGVDVVPELIEAARTQGGGRFQTMSYAQIAGGELDAKADVAICNFSLLGKASTEA